MTLPEAVAELIARPVAVGEPAQAFAFLTVDHQGFPHLALLSAVELAAGADGTLHAVLGGTTTRANVLRSRHASVIAVEGDTVHTVKLEVRRARETEGVLAVVFEVCAHKADSLGIALSPIGFRPTVELASLERWDRARRVLAGLGEALGG